MLIDNITAEYYVPDTAKCNHLWKYFTYKAHSGTAETHQLHQRHIELLSDKYNL